MSFLAAGCGDSSEIQEISGAPAGAVVSQGAAVQVQGQTGKLDVNGQGAVTVTFDDAELKTLNANGEADRALTIEQFIQRLNGTNALPANVQVSYLRNGRATAILFTLTDVQRSGTDGLALRGTVQPNPGSPNPPALQGTVQPSPEIQVVVGQPVQNLLLRFGGGNQFDDDDVFSIILGNQPADLQGLQAVPFSARVYSLDNDNFSQTASLSVTEEISVDVPHNRNGVTGYGVDFTIDGYITTTITTGTGSAGIYAYSGKAVCNKLQPTGSPVATLTVHTRNDDVFDTDSNFNRVTVSGGGYSFEAYTGENGDSNFQNIPANVTLTVTAYDDDDTTVSGTATTTLDSQETQILDFTVN